MSNHKAGTELRRHSDSAEVAEEGVEAEKLLVSRTKRINQVTRKAETLLGGADKANPGEGEGKAWNRHCWCHANPTPSEEPREHSVEIQESQGYQERRAREGMKYSCPLPQSQRASELGTGGAHLGAEPAQWLERGCLGPLLKLETGC